MFDGKWQIRRFIRWLRSAASSLPGPAGSTAGCVEIFSDPDWPGRNRFSLGWFLFEVFSGVMADAFGRRSSMIDSSFGRGVSGRYTGWHPECAQRHDIEYNGAFLPAGDAGFRFFADVFPGTLMVAPLLGALFSIHFAGKAERKLPTERQQKGSRQQKDAHPPKKDGRLLLAKKAGEPSEEEETWNLSIQWCRMEDFCIQRAPFYPFWICRWICRCEATIYRHPSICIKRWLSENQNAYRLLKKYHVPGQPPEIRQIQQIPARRPACLWKALLQDTERWGNTVERVRQRLKEVQPFAVKHSCRQNETGSCKSSCRAENQVE